ncbi:MAG: SDR family NAD(P)-dependent oxidoreductase [Janthinobacterium lividum]
MTPHAIISGGSSGIGLALARKLAESGHHLTILARDPTRLDVARRELEGVRLRDDQRILVLSVDVCDAPAVKAAVERGIAENGAPTLVVANAGIVIPYTFADLTPEAFRQSMDVNYLGGVYLVHAALAAMQAAGRGHIVLVSSGAGLLGIYGLSAYTPTKFALRGLGEVLRAELKPQGIGVSVVYPPDTDTPMLREEIKVRPLITSRIAATAKAATAQDVADAILKGVAKKQFSIAPGLTLGALAHLGSLIGPLVNRLYFDPLIARLLKRPARP